MIKKLQAENKKWTDAQRKTIDRLTEAAQKQLNASRQREEIRARLTLEQRRIDDSFSSILELYNDEPQLAVMAKEREIAARELEALGEYVDASSLVDHDSQISESSISSVYDEDLEPEPLASPERSVEVVAGALGPDARATPVRLLGVRSTPGGICRSSAIPMGVYKPGMHPMTGRPNPEPEKDNDVGCFGWGLWCWNWNFWRYLGCERDGTQHGRVESIGS